MELKFLILAPIHAICAVLHNLTGLYVGNTHSVTQPIEPVPYMGAQRDQRQADNNIFNRPMGLFKMKFIRPNAIYKPNGLFL
jgi:hypothetical protein